MTWPDSSRHALALALAVGLCIGLALAVFGQAHGAQHRAHTLGAGVVFAAAASVTPPAAGRSQRP